MRTSTIEIETEGKSDAEIQEIVNQEAPWASAWARVEGGVKCFESRDDHRIWIAQA